MYNIILPTYNEKENIKPMLFMIDTVFKEINKEYKIILIDDNSPDGTFNEAKKYSKKIEIELIKRKQKLGLGSAYKEGLKYCEFDFIIILDSDLSHNPYDIKRMIEMMEKEKCDIVSSTRYINDKESGTFGWNFKRRLTSRFANNLAQIVLGIDNSDLTGSFRLYKKEVFESLIESVKSKGYSYQMEILYLAVKNEFKICELPIIFHERTYGVSKLGFKEIFNFIMTLIVLFFK